MPAAKGLMRLGKALAKSARKSDIKMNINKVNASTVGPNETKVNKQFSRSGFTQSGARQQSIETLTRKGTSSGLDVAIKKVGGGTPPKGTATKIQAGAKARAYDKVKSDTKRRMGDTLRARKKDQKKKR